PSEEKQEQTSRSASKACRSLDRMEKIRARLQVSFSTRVIVPVVTVMVLLLAITVWLVNGRISRQFQAEAGRSLTTADAVFRHYQEIEAHNLQARYHNLPKEPRYKAAFQTLDP